MTILAIDIGGSKISAGLIDADQNVNHFYKMTSPKVQTVQSFTQTLEQVIGQFAPSDYTAVSVATAGVVNHSGHLTALVSKNLGGLHEYPMIPALKSLVPNKDVYALNDAQAATWAEYTHAQQAFMAFITVSTGVGGGFVLDGELYRGPNGLAGHLGHMLADLHGIEWGSGRTGCVESVASGSAIALGTKDWVKPLTAAQVFEAYRQGADDAIALVDKAAQAIAHCIVDVVALLDIHEFYLGGSVALNPEFLQRVRVHIAHYPPSFHANVHSAHYQHHAGLVGAAAYYRHLKRLSRI